MNLEELNGSPSELAGEHLKQCCGSEAWVIQMMRRRPFKDVATLEAVSNEVWWALAEHDWLEAFAAHPRIGHKNTSGDGPAERWSSEEQKGMDEAGADVDAAIQQLNRRYEERFGWIFIVCATGKSAIEMRDLMSERLNNTAINEIQIAAAEQAKITRLRLAKMLAE